MSKLPDLSYRDVIKVLRKAGFEYDRNARGSHEIWFNQETRKRTVIPHHSGSISKGTLRAIINQAGLTLEEFIKHL